jgi:hypothetical protein
MRIIELNIDNTTRPHNLASELKQFNLQQGDKLKVTTLMDEVMTLTIIWVVFSFLYQKKMEYADKVLKDVLTDRGIRELQNEITKEYGIDVQVESKSVNEDENWNQFSKEKLSKAYGNNEPDYELSMVKEPNPSYKK